MTRQSRQSRIACLLIVSLIVGCQSTLPVPDRTAPPVSEAPTLAPSATRTPTSSSSSFLDPIVPDEVRSRSALPVCGDEPWVSPVLEVVRSVRECFLEAHQEGRGAEFTSTAPTMDGDPIATIYRTLPDGTIELFTDSTRSRIDNRAWTYKVCRDLVADDDKVFELADCSIPEVLKNP